MLSLQSYVNLLRTDIIGLLDQTEDRTIALDEHIDLLKSYYVRTGDRTALLAEQSRDLSAIILGASQSTLGAKQSMEEKYKAFEYE